MEVRIRNIEDWVVEWHRQNAKRAGRSLEAELSEALANVALERKRALAAELKANLDQLRDKYGEFPDSTPALRAERDQ